jgi:hypothetical protein
MSASVSSWLALTIVLGVLASFAIWARGYSRARGLAVVGFLLASPAAAGALGYSLGWPVPYVQGVTVPPGKHPILGMKLLVGKGIYLLLDIGEEEPRYYSLPWSATDAQKLQEGMDEEASQGVVVKPFEWSWERRPQFYADPQPKMMPDKPQQEAPPVYSHEI